MATTDGGRGGGSSPETDVGGEGHLSPPLSPGSDGAALAGPRPHPSSPPPTSPRASASGGVWSSSATPAPQEPRRHRPRSHHHPPASVPDAVLSLAKTSRYVSHLSALLGEVFAPYLPPPPSGAGGGPPPSPLRSVRPELDLLSTLVHLAALVWRDGRTVGMESMGLGYGLTAEEDEGGEAARRRARGSVAKADSEVVPPRVLSAPSTTGRGGVAAYSSLRERPASTSSPSSSSSVALLPSSLGGATARAAFFVILSVVPRYLVERAGRGGWQEISFVLSKLPLRRIGGWRCNTVASNHPAAGGGEGVAGSSREDAVVGEMVVNGEREVLRGSDRRSAFEEQRRRMMSYARADAAEQRIRRQRGGREGVEEGKDEAGGSSAGAPSDGGDGRSRESALSEERLITAPDRRADPAPVPARRHLETEPSPPLTRRSSATRSSPRLAAVIAVLRRKLWFLLRSAHDALSQVGPAPHDPAVPGHVVGIGAGAGVAAAPEEPVGEGRRYDRSSSSSSSAVASVLKWALRLHLALFYLDGRYPTWSHRLAGVRMACGAPSPTGGGGMKIVSDRPTYRILGVIVAAQAASALAGALARAGVDVAHRWRIGREPLSVTASARRIRGQGEHGTTPEGGGEDARRRCAASLERRVPSILSAPKPCGAAAANPRRRQRILRRSGDGDGDAASDPPSVRRTCGICVRPRVHPAASRNCGHVLCWECYQRWIGSVRRECPVCRAPAGPGDIVPLYGY